MIEELEATYQTLVDDGYVTDGDTQLNSAVSNKVNTSLSGTFTFTRQEISCFIDCLFRIATFSSMDRALPFVIKYNYLQRILIGLRFVDI